MTPKIYISSDNITTSLGFDTESTIKNLIDSVSGIRQYNDPDKSQIPFWASLLEDSKLKNEFQKVSGEGTYSRLEQMLILSILDALEHSEVDVTTSKTAIVISTAKGNVDLLEKQGVDIRSEEKLYLSDIGRTIQRFFKNPNAPVIISNGCISGVLALITSKRLIQGGQFENVIVTGGDIISEFTISGFQSFKALSDAPCKPFDKSRTGLNLGEGAATIILTSQKEKANKEKIEIIGGSVSNDANHISGPSRTGEGLYISIKKALKEAESEGLPKLGYLSAHGTATVYNDEMESLAFTSAQLEEVPVNSLKGYFGHTLGAAGLIESVISVQSLSRNQLFGSVGYEELGVTGNLNIIKNTEKKEMQACLKTASGFGGCNAAIIFRKNG